MVRPVGRVGLRKTVRPPNGCGAQSDVTRSSGMAGRRASGVDRLFVDRITESFQRRECRPCDNPCHLCS